ncbi:MAG TPA: response regulator [Acidimicrobiales bacterium]|nr:response regulator [Acidimicrobiales bacterium]
MLLVIKDESVRELLDLILGLDGRFPVAAATGCLAGALVMVDHLQPSVVVLDLDADGVDGVAAVAEFRRRLPEAGIVVISAFPDPFTLMSVVSAGADVYLDTAQAFAELVPTIMCLEEPGARGAGLLESSSALSA